MFPAVLIIRKYVWFMFHLLFVKFYFIFFGAFAKLRKATLRFIMSVCLPNCPSLRMEQLRSHWTDFHEIRPLSQILIHAKLQIGKGGQKQLTGRRPLRRRGSALDCSAI